MDNLIFNKTNEEWNLSLASFEEYVSEHLVFMALECDVEENIDSPMPGLKRSSKPAFTALKECAGSPFEDIQEKLGEPLHIRLMRFIDVRGLKDSDVYKKADITRQTFSKIRSGEHIPKKKTLFCLCLALELNLDDAKDLLMSAGYSISDTSIVDLAFEYFVKNEIYDLNEANLMLYEVYHTSLTDQ